MEITITYPSGKKRLLVVPEAIRVKDLVAKIYEYRDAFHRDLTLIDYMHLVELYHDNPGPWGVLPQLSLDTTLSDYNKTRATDYKKIHDGSTIRVIDRGYAKQKQEERRKYLIESFNRMSQSELTENLHYYVGWEGKKLEVEKLIELGADVNGRMGLLNRTPLMEAVTGSGAAEIVPLLLAKGACIDAVDDSGHTALELARDAHSDGAITVLKQGASVAHDPNRAELLRFAKTYLNTDPSLHPSFLAPYIARETMKKYFDEQRTFMVDDNVINHAHATIVKSTIFGSYYGGVVAGPALSFFTTNLSGTALRHEWIILELSSGSFICAQFSRHHDDRIIKVTLHDTEANALEKGRVGNHAYKICQAPAKEHYSAGDLLFFLLENINSEYGLFKNNCQMLARKLFGEIGDENEVMEKNWQYIHNQGQIPGFHRLPDNGVIVTCTIL